jgi:hypothetical protein
MLMLQDPSSMLQAAYVAMLQLYYLQCCCAAGCQHVAIPHCKWLPTAMLQAAYAAMLHTAHLLADLPSTACCKTAGRKLPAEQLPAENAA